MAKILVTTFNNTLDNYGQVLQYLATQEYLRNRGHRPYLLVSKGNRVLLIDRIKQKVRSVLSRFKRKYQPVESSNSDSIADEKKKLFTRWTLISEMLELKHPRFFSDFRKSNFESIECFFEDIASCHFDVYAVGSDQTWSWISEQYFLNFGSKHVKRIAIAPSVGHSKYTEGEVLSLTERINQFDFITVREKSGLDLCKRAGYSNAVKVLDPTFLISADFYDNYISPSEHNYPKPYIFLYLLGGEIGINVDEIYEFATAHNLDVKYVASQGRDDSFDKEWARVDEWLMLIKQASYVITNSFHGMCFSIIYRKNFVVMPIVGIMSSMNERIDDLANQMNLQNRIYSDSLDILFNDIDYHTANNVTYDNCNTVNKFF